MSRNERRPTDNGERSDSKVTDGRGKFPSFGFPGKLEAARKAAPDDAESAEIENVAWVAFERSVHPRKVWREKANCNLDEWDGDTGA